MVVTNHTVSYDIIFLTWLSVKYKVVWSNTEAFTLIHA